METERANLFRIVGGNIRKKSKREVGNDPEDRDFSDASDGEKRFIKKNPPEIARRFSYNNLLKTVTEPDYISDQELKDAIAKYEINKTEKQKLVIRCANILINELRDIYGLPPFNLPVENVRLFDNEFFVEQGIKYQAVAMSSKNTIIINFNSGGENLHIFRLIGIIVHEMIHLALSANAYQVRAILNNNDFEHNTEVYRAGISVLPSHSNSRKTNAGWRGFHGIDEAEVAFLTKKFFTKIFNFEELREEGNIFKSERYKEIQELVAERHGLDKTELVCTDDSLNNWMEYFGYKIHRQVLVYIQDEIQKETKISKEEIEDLFEEALVTGKLLKISKLIKKVFGQDGFKVVVSMTDQDQSAKDVLIKLKEIRLKEKEF